MTVKKAAITCPRCKGTGQERLREPYASTLKLVKKHGPISGTAVSVILGIKAAAACNRLSRLEAMGLVIPTRDGRQVLWVVAK